MKKLTLLTLLALIGCANSGQVDSSLVRGVTKVSSNLYSVSEMHLFTGNPMAQAALQCEKDGNKNLNIVSSSTRNSRFSNTQYAVIIFKCGN